MPSEARTLPDYADGSIVNFVQSIARAGGAPRQRYAELAALPAERLASARHIVLFVFDGLGEKTLEDFPEGEGLRRHRVASLRSVFPSTTATAITTFMTALAPAQHGLTGWHMHLAEIDETLAILPMTVRGDPRKALPADLAARIFTYPTLFQQLARECTVLVPQNIADSPFNAAHSRGARTLAYASPGEMFAQVAALLNDAARPRYIYAYYPEIDTLSHRFGSRSAEAGQALATLAALFGEFVAQVEGSDSWLLATADHGFIDSPPDRVVRLDDHRELAAMLTRPLCGEARVAYCYVAAAKRPAFAAYVRRHLAHCAELVPSAELIEAGWFGPPPCHGQLAARVGDFTLIMHENWTIKDWVPGEKQHTTLGVHGGLSDDEMRVPLLARRV